MKEYFGKIDENDLEYVIRLRGETPIAALPCPLKRGKINPQTSRFLFKDGSMSDVVHVKPIYYHTADRKEWRPLYEVASYYGNKGGMILKPDAWSKIHSCYLNWYIKRQKILNGKGIRVGYDMGAWRGIPLKDLQRPLVLNTACSGTSGVDCFPDPNPETTSVDGIAFRDVTSETFSTIRTSAGNGSDDVSGSTQSLRLRASTTTNQYNLMIRGYFLFDTSNIADSNTIDSATFSLFGSTPDVHNFGGEASMIATSPSSNTAIASGDYLNITYTRQASDILDTSWSTIAYNNWTLNATGLGNVSKTGVSKFGTVTSWDMDNTAPTWSSSGADTFTTFHAEETGTTKDPKLNVIHSAAAVGMNLINLLGVG